jgi:Tfp pilus assembly protein PilX
LQQTLAPARQSGAALFVALIILVLLTLLVLAAARVTSLQERMAGVYYADARAFEEAEDRLRAQEREVLAGDPDQMCTTAPGTGVPAGWTNGTATAAGSVIENLNNPQSAASRGIGVGRSRQGGSLIPGGPGCLLFRISAFDFDSPGQTSSAVVQSNFVP